jgi:NAD(P)-dependent dehydrogenase (short-subunit alcohol dehydrogenase family)
MQSVCFMACDKDAGKVRSNRMAMLEGRVVAVTGAGRGIGRDIGLLRARRCSGGGQRSRRVVRGWRRRAGGADRRRHRRHRRQANADTASVTDPAGAASIIGEAVQRFGRIDAVVNNAGILRDRIWHKMSHEDSRAVIDVHLNGPFNVSMAATRTTLKGELKADQNIPVTLNLFQGPCAVGGRRSGAPGSGDRGWMLKQVQHDG